MDWESSSEISRSSNLQAFVGCSDTPPSCLSTYGNGQLIIQSLQQSCCELSLKAIYMSGKNL